MKASSRLQPPFSQGDLDALCGVYAIVNAIRLATQDVSATLDDEDWHRLFAKLMKEAHRRVGALRAATRGIDTAPLWRLIAVARTHVSKRHGLDFAIERPFHGRDGVPVRIVLHWLAGALDEQASAVLLGLGAEFDHWTVAHRFTAQYLSFYDSAGFTRVRLDRCRRDDLIDGPSLVRFRLRLTVS